MYVAVRFEAFQQSIWDVATCFPRCCNSQFKMLQHFYGCCNNRFEMLQHVFLMLQQSIWDVATCFSGCCNSRFKMLQHVFFNVATVDLRCCNIFFNVTWGFSMLQTFVLECCKQWLTSDPFVSLSVFLLHVWQGAVSASAIESITTIFVVYYCMIAKRRELKGDERWDVMGRAKTSGSERERAQRKPPDPKREGDR